MSKPGNPELANKLYLWLTENMDLPFSLHLKPPYEVHVNGFALKTRLQLMNQSKRNLARFCLILGALLGVGIGWTLPW